MREGSFNGATSSRTWKGGWTLILITAETVLQWSHVLTNVESHRKFNNCGGYNTLQWSHVLTNVESRCRAKGRPLRSAASMEPRPHERGKFKLRAVLHSASEASMEPRPHERGKQNKTPQWLRLLQSFNGATSSRTWKARRSSWIFVRARQLQWSHVLTNVERTDAPLAGFVTENASMEPRPHERGKPRRAAPLAQEERWLQWSHVLTNVESWP